MSSTRLRKKTGFENPEIADAKGTSMGRLATKISAKGHSGNFSSAIRVYILSTYTSTH